MTLKERLGASLDMSEAAASERRLTSSLSGTVTAQLHTGAKKAGEYAVFVVRQIAIRCGCDGPAA
jgi:hypothetical protein